MWWQQISDTLPAGATLLVYPNAESPLLAIMQRLASEFKHRGRDVLVVPAEHVLQGSSVA